MTARFVLACLIGIVPQLALQAADDKDTIWQKNNQAPTVHAYILAETPTELQWTTVKGSTNAVKKRWSDIVNWKYAWMSGEGPWQRALEEKARGKYEDAADLFNQVAGSGEESQKVYGSFMEGDCREMAGKFQQAADAFARVGILLNHRLGMDGKYRQGFALALAGKDAEANKLADELSTKGKDGVLGAESRANAIRCAVAYAKKERDKMIELSKKANFRPFEEPETWFHFGMFYADKLREFKKSADAKLEYVKISEMLDKLPQGKDAVARDSTNRARISLGIGLSLVDSDKGSAVIELVKLDALPFGSVDQKCEARYNAGKIMWEDAESQKKNSDLMKDPKKAEFQKDLERNARMLLSAAANSGSVSPACDGAKALLTTIGPDPEEKAAKDAADKAAKEKEKAEKEKAGDKTGDKAKAGDKADDKEDKAKGEEEEAPSSD